MCLSPFPVWCPCKNRKEKHLKKKKRERDSAKPCLTLMTPWTVACQVPLSMGFSRQEYRSRLPFPSPGDLCNPRIKPQADSLPTELHGKPQLGIVLKDKGPEMGLLWMRFLQIFKYEKLLGSITCVVVWLLLHVRVSGLPVVHYISKFAWNMCSRV